MSITDEILEQLRNNDPALQSLDLGANYLGLEGTIVLIEALKINTTLQSLSLEWNNLGPQGAIALAETLKINTTLQSLNLSDNNFTLQGVTSLSDHNLAVQGAIALAEALKTNTTLKSLDLSGNNLGSEDAIALAEALKTNTTLQSLNLHWNNIGPEGAAAITKVMKHNYTLLTLDGITSPDIIQYLKRNQEIASCLAPLHDFNLDILNLESINEKLEALTRLAPELTDTTNPLPDTHHLSEKYRLLATLSHLAGGDYHTVSQYLEEPFHTPQLQTMADKAFSKALFLTPAFDTADEVTKKARYQWLAYQHRHAPESPQLKLGLTGFKQPNQTVMLDKISDNPQRQTDGSYLLPYQALGDVAEKAYLNLEDKKTPEALLLAACLKQKTYHHATIGKLFKTAAFLEELHLTYPENNDFHCLETALFFENMDITYQIPTFPNVIQPMGEEEVVRYEKTIEQLEKHAPQPKLEDKLIETKVELCRFMTAPTDEDKSKPGL